MAINLLDIKPHKVSTDLSGYITYIYGSPKTGKTTLATQMEGSLLLAFEQGYNTLPGVMAYDITSWGEMKQVFRELKKPEVKKVYKALIVDTVDVAADKCKKYICEQNDIEDLGDLGYGKGWNKFKEEFTNIFRGLTELGYAVFFIGHDKEVIDEEGNITIRPALSNSNRTLISGMADVYGYAHQKNIDDKKSTLTLRCPDGSIDCGCRFKYIPNEIPTDYQTLVRVLGEAITKEAAEHDNKFITDERIAAPTQKTYNFNDLMTEFQSLVEQLMTKDKSNGIKITTIVEKYLGKGKKVSDATPNQSEFIDLINSEIKDELF